MEYGLILRRATFMAAPAWFGTAEKIMPQRAVQGQHAAHHCEEVNVISE